MPSLNTGNAILSNPIKVETTAYNVGIGAAASSSFKLQVTGTTNLTGALTGTSATFSGDLTVDTNTLFVDSTNNRVGIGTTTTTYKLDVSGSGSMINIIGASSGDIATGFRIGRGASLGAEIYDNPADNITTFNTTGGLNLRVGGSNRLTIASTGAATFSNDVVIGNGKFLQTVRATGGALIDAIGIQAGTDTLQIKGGTSGATNAINFYDTGGLIATFYNGRLGIGTSSPSALLHLVQSTTNLNLYLQNTSGSGKTWAVNSDSNGSFNIHDTSINYLSITSNGTIISTGYITDQFNKTVAGGGTFNLFSVNLPGVAQGAIIEFTFSFISVGNAYYGGVVVYDVFSIGGTSTVTLRYSVGSNVIPSPSVSGGTTTFSMSLPSGSGSIGNVNVRIMGNSNSNGNNNGITYTVL